MNIIEFAVPAVPMAINKLIRKHWTVRRDNKQRWMTEINASIRKEDKRILRAWADCCYKVKIDIIVFHKRMFDPDNLWSAAKHPLDCLVTLGYLQGDRNEHISLNVTQEKSKYILTQFKIRKLE